MKHVELWDIDSRSPRPPVIFRKIKSCNIHKGLMAITSG